MRPDWHTYFVEFAKVAATRATCQRLKVGAVVVVDKQVVATGYNGSAPGLPHCTDVGCDVVGGHCIRTVHAEMNAIAQAARRGVKIDGASIYTTAAPCWNCFRVLLNAGIAEYIWVLDYRFEGEMAERILAAAKVSGVKLARLADLVPRPAPDLIPHDGTGAL